MYYRFIIISALYKFISIIVIYHINKYEYLVIFITLLEYTEVG